MIVLGIFASILYASGYSVERRPDNNTLSENGIFFSALILIFRRLTFEREQLAGATTSFALRFDDSAGCLQS